MNGQRLKPYFRRDKNNVSQGQPADTFSVCSQNPLRKMQMEINMESLLKQGRQNPRVLSPVGGGGGGGGGGFSGGQDILLHRHVPRLSLFASSALEDVASILRYINFSILFYSILIQKLHNLV